MSRKRLIVLLVVVVALLVVGLGVALTAGKSSNANSTVVILSRVQRRTLQGTVALNGTLARKSIRNVTAASTGLVSAVTAKDGTTTRTGNVMFALSGREGVAEQGDLPFFRSLAPGDSGPDVLELKQILAAAGNYPGPMDNQFTQQTQFALAQWQAQHHYPNSTPATPEAVTVTLEQGAGYKLGPQDSAGLVIGPPAATTAATTGGPAHATLVDLGTTLRPFGPTPVLTIQSVSNQVVQGQPATFVISASAAPTSDLTVNLTPGGTAGSNDVVTPPTSAVILANTTSAEVSVQTRDTNTVGADTTISMTIAGGAGYTVGAPSSATTTIANDNVPTITITGGATVSPGGSDTLTLTASQAPIQNTPVTLSFAGSAAPGTNYTAPNPVVTLAAGSTTATVTINTLSPNVIEPNAFILVSITPNPAAYAVGSPGSAVVAITGSSALPSVTLTSATNYLEKGSPYVVTVGLSQAISSPLTISLTYGGSAVQGVDYVPPAGSIVVPAGQTSLPVQIPTITDNVVEPDQTLTVSLAPSSAYTVGTPSSTSVTITSSVVPQLSISVSQGTVSQGGAASFVITANQAPSKATSVNFAVAGTAQPGQAYVPLPGTALLPAGQTSVTVTLQTLQTNVTFEPTDMIVGNWPIRVGQVYVKAGQPVAPGTAILSLTQPELTVTLQASASNRTQLQVGQSCTVQIDGANTEASGTITELDATPTTVAASTPGQASQQVYEGKIEAPGLVGADGSAVSITVVTQQATDALTVPIAAVKQSGLGRDVVRVINLADGGRVSDVRVTTGLTEGSYIQIKSGLHLGQTVVVAVNQQ